MEDKEQFDEVPDDFKKEVAEMDVVQIKQCIAQVALDQVVLMKAKKEDQDLKEKHNTYKEAGVLYKKGTKLNRLKIEYCKMMIDTSPGRSKK